MKRVVGCSTGCLFLVNPSRRQQLEQLIEAGITAVELMFHDLAELEELGKERLAELVESLSFFSIHAPTSTSFLYGDGSEEDVLCRELLKDLCLHLPVEHVVMHPELVADHSLISEWEIPVVFENSDFRKPVGKSIKSMRRILNEAQTGMVLDVNHVYSNDASMQLLRDFISELGDMIVEFHVSGFDENLLHVPMQQMKDLDEMRKSFYLLEEHGAPLILESPVRKKDWKEQLQKEIQLVEGEYE